MSDDELNEGVTPAAKIYSGPPLVNKTDPFKGDGFYPGTRVKVPRVDTIGSKLQTTQNPGLQASTNPGRTIEHVADEMLNDVVRKAKPAKLDNLFTTDEELQDLARQVEDRTIANWPMLRRLINRLLRAEGK